MDKDNRYWKIHKETYNELLEGLDLEIANRIYSNPNCAEARLLNRKVEKQIAEILEREPVV